MVCFLPGTMALGVQHGMPHEHLEVAKALAKTCREMYRTLTGLAPEIAYFNMIPGTKEDVIIKVKDSNILRLFFSRSMRIVF